ncbi:MAG: DHA2 family efflux MFS transporter permease subunit [Hyphomonas sp.]|nr:DHA2 family efflux MFS transporter permease subunit [Hyphomonas sp.]MCB9960892.1 DHA2 family efflux MFS transporter permease subunit [Hyphomonas sp.]MCB9970183.1 DHA2 family efflux MFS transporter permease subunit [Hyphomonas sp.]
MVSAKDRPVNNVTLNIGFFAMVIGMFMAILDIQIVASSIRQIQAGVSASQEEIAWIQSGYLVAEVVGIPLSGFLNRVFGIRKLFIMSAAGFVASSILCAMSWDLDSLIFFRVVQGFSGAAMVPTTMAASFTLFPAGRSMTQQVMIGMVATLAPSIGPTLGGWITQHAAWHWLFLINIVPGAAAITLVYMFVPHQKGEISLLRRLDTIALISMAIFLGLFEWIVDEGPGDSWFQSAVIVKAVIICVTAGIIFAYRVLNSPVPLVDLTVFRDRNFASGALIGSVMGFGLYGSVFLLPLYLGQVRGYSSLQIGEVMSVAGLAMFLGGPISGALTRRYDPRYVVALGLVLAACGTWLNGHLNSESSFRELFWPQALRGAGLILTMVPTTNLALGTLPPDRVANASGLFTVCRNLGGAIGIAVLNTMMLHYNRLHEQEIASGLSLARPDVQSFLTMMTERLRAAGVTDPEGSAMAQLVYRAKLEAAVMTYNNLFLTMSMSFALILLVVLLLDKPKVRAAQPAH